jgi:uncharacterized membrane protein YidH (DUF202 family)
LHLTIFVLDPEKRLLTRIGQKVHFMAKTRTSITLSADIVIEELQEDITGEDPCLELAVRTDGKFVERSQIRRNRKRKP